MFVGGISRFSLVVLCVGFLTVVGDAGTPPKPKFDVKIVDEKTVITEIGDSGVIDPVKRINFDGQNGNFILNIRTIRNETLHLSHFPSFMINDQLIQFFNGNGAGGRFEKMNVPLKKGPNGKPRDGYSSHWIYGDIHVTQTVELHPSKAKGPDQKRPMNNVLISYLFENKGQQAKKIAARAYMDTYVISNDGCMFAAPVTHPGKILDGIVLEGKTLPPYLQMLQVPNLKAPGYVSHLTLNLGSRYEKANKLVLTRHGQGFQTFDMQAVPSMGDSGIGLFWENKELKPGGKREIAYVYGEGVAVAPESEGRFQFGLAGSFEPGKLCTISALVADPPLGQSLVLELPAGMELVNSRQVQAVAPVAEGQEFSSIQWTARVLKAGAHPIRIRSSTGVTQTKVVTVSAK